jgi:hypothetical protein
MRLLLPDKLLLQRLRRHDVQKMRRDVVIIERVLQNNVVKRGCMEFFSVRDDIHHVAAIYHSSDNSHHMVKVSSREGGSEQDAGKHAMECAGQD